MLTTANTLLAGSLFRQVMPARQQPAPVRDIQQAARNANQRWPELAGMVDAAVVLVEDSCLYELAGEPTALAICPFSAVMALTWAWISDSTQQDRVAATSQFDRSTASAGLWAPAGR